MGKFPLDSVKQIGRYTYGRLNVLAFGGDGEALSIGDFCSISSGTLFILGGEHRTDKLMTFPFGHFVLDDVYDSKANRTKGPIIVGNDVWIGTGATILSGITIGNGAVIGAGSVVAKDIKPYEVVAGSPIIHLRYRFSDRIRNLLEALDYSKLTPEIIARIHPLLEKPLDETVLGEILMEIGQ